MILKLFDYLGDRRVINKTLSSFIDFNIILRADFNIKSPELIIVSELDLTNYNYATISELERNYFINEVVNIGNNIYKLILETDFLTTYKDVILNSESVFNRKLKNGDYINIQVDSSVLKTFDKIYSDVSISDERSMILSTVGVI